MTGACSAETPATGARLAMRLVVKTAEVAGVSRLIDIGSAHVGSCYSSGATGLDFARRLAASGTRVARPPPLPAR